MTLRGREYLNPGSTLVDLFQVTNTVTAGNSLCQTKTYDFGCATPPGHYEFQGVATNAARAHNSARGLVRVLSSPSCGGSPALTLASDCTPFDDFIFYTYTFGPGATPGLSSLSYSYVGQSDTWAGNIGSAWAQGTASGGGPNSFVESGELAESYQFRLRVEIGQTPGTLSVTDGTHSSQAAVPDGNGVTAFCNEP